MFLDLLQIIFTCCVFQWTPHNVGFTVLPRSLSLEKQSSVNIHIIHVHLDQRALASFVIGHLYKLAHTDTLTMPLRGLSNVLYKY